MASPTLAYWSRAALCALPLLWSACGPKNGNAAPESSAASNRSTQATAELWNAFRGDLAWAEVEKQVACGARPAGSAALEKARTLIEQNLQTSGWQVERQVFDQPTPHGAKRMVNLIARFPAKTPALSKKKTPVEAAPEPGSRALVASHYDTKIFSTIVFVGANDGASSTGALVELARVLALDPELASRIDLVFFDGEEAVQQFSETDGLYGSRYFATHLRKSGQAAQYGFGIVWDMIGDKKLNITLPIDSPKPLARAVLDSAEALGVRSKFGLLDRALLDDHVPLQQIARIPALDIIDFDYSPWHTADDTLPQISAESLQTIGAVTLHHLCKTLRPAR
jgi:glutaminyl-peptide cyclotransferase